MATWAVLNTIGCCSGCMLALESLSRESVNPANLVTFTTFVLATVDGLVRKPNLLFSHNIPIRSILIIILSYFIVNLINNHSIHFNVPFPLFLIFRSGTLLANVILTFLLQNRRYSWIKLASVLLVTLGIVLFTWESSKNKTCEKKEEWLWIDLFPCPRFVTGMIMMSICLFMSAYMGIMQEEIYKNHGKHPEELMFLIHFYSLPFFAFIGSDILESFSRCRDGIPMAFAGIELPISKSLLTLLTMCLLQLICIKNVYQLTVVLPSLGVTMVLTIRKFLNLFLSVYIFGNEFTKVHALGTVCVLLGTFAFYDGFSKLSNLFRHKKIA